MIYRYTKLLKTMRYKKKYIGTSKPNGYDMQVRYFKYDVLTFYKDYYKSFGVYLLTVLACGTP